MSMDNRVVGLVLVAPTLLNVCGSETKDADERDGAGEDGVVGGMGRMEASSSASPRLESFQDEMVVDLLSETVLSTLSAWSTVAVFVLRRGSERALSRGRGLCFRCG